MNAPGHLMILASAGAGKTYALTTRFVRLLAAGAPPERIVALTFTRKAAGEFFDEILNRLAAAAGEDGAAAKLAKEVERPELGRPEFLRLLRTMVDAMPRLNLGTLDGFFARMVRCFPLELGLGGEFALLEEAEARSERRRVMGLIFAAGATGAEARRDFFEAFKRATHGVEEKALRRCLDRFLDEHGETYRAAPAAAWGRADCIWPDGGGWLEGAEEVGVAVAAGRAALRNLEGTEGPRRRLEAFLDAAELWEPGAVMSAPLEYGLKNILAAWGPLQAGTATVTLDRIKVPFGPAEGRALAGVVKAVAAAEVRRRLEMTRGLHAVLAGYERVYDEQVRQAGRLTFADVQRLLQPGGGALPDPDRRLLLDWRLDARFDHWLLDEFQDTSREQWSILRNLIDEAVQDAEGRRSFFYVGDVKQAIYGWRGGDARLFREIFSHYNQAAPGTVGEEHLERSYRSGPAIIALVNAVGGDNAALGEAVPPRVVERWIREWRPHESAHPDQDGVATLEEVDGGEDGRFERTRGLLREIGADRRGLTAAVLVQSNDVAARLAEFLRADGLPAVAESDLRVARDNPLTCAVLALLRSAAYPGDTLAAGVVAMSPVGECLRELGWTDPDRVTLGVLEEVRQGGFAGMVEAWVGRLQGRLAADDVFNRLRGRQLIDAAEAFDAGGGRQVAAFLEWAELFTVREAEAPGVVRVMTVHKSKGLGFDVVVLPDLQGSSLAQRRRGLAVHRGPDQVVDWVLDLPPKLLVEHDPVLAAQLAKEEEEAAYESLCLLYVALTRAKRALHVLIDPVGKSRSRNLPKLLTAALGSAWQAGNPGWYEAVSAGEESAAEDPARALAAEWPVPGRRVLRRVAHHPSQAAPAVLPAGVWFSPRRPEATAWGDAIHALLAQVEWIETAEVTDWVRESTAGGADPAAVESVAACLAEPALRSVFARPINAAQADLWRERAFETVVGEVWLSGVFDRVVIERDADGFAQRASVYDFKTDGVGDATEARTRAGRHAEQLRIYRDAVMRLAGLSREQVRAWVVFTGLRLAVEVT